MIIRRIDPMSCAKVTGVLYVLTGLILGACFSLFSLAGMGASRSSSAFGALFGVGAIIVLPIFYGVFGAVFSFLSALLYNVVAGWLGGIEIETT